MAYSYLVNQGKAATLEDVVQIEDIAQVMRTGLTSPNPDLVKIGMRWLGGEPKVPIQQVGPALQPQLLDSREFGAVMHGISHMYLTVEGKVPLYMVDEAERFQNVANVDAYYTWLASLRELTELPGIAVMFFVGAKTRNDLPAIFVTDECQRRNKITAVWPVL